jgi:hypothetical protein
VTEVFETRRKDVLRLIIAEGPRFPKLAEFYYHEVIERILAALRALLTRAVERGELPNDALVRFPQLLMAPAGACRRSVERTVRKPRAARRSRVDAGAS